MHQILVIQTASIGDVILATALVEQLHHNVQGSVIDLLVRKGHESLFNGHPYLRQVLTWDKRSGKYAQLASLLQRIRKTRYDEVINIQRFLATGILTALSGAIATTGFSKNPLSMFFTKSVRHEIAPGVHEVQRNMALLSSSSINLSGKAKSDSGRQDPVGTAGMIRPRLYPAASDLQAIASFAGGVYYTVSPASLWFTKQFPATKWVEMIRLIPFDARIYLLGAPSDHPLCEQIIEQAAHPGLKNLAGSLTFLQSAALMAQARMNFTNDSAPMHLASSVNAPVTVVYCSTVPGFGFGPLSDNSTIVEFAGVLPCRPCGLHGHRSCPEQHFRCALGIDVSRFSKVI